MKNHPAKHLLALLALGCAALPVQAELAIYGNVTVASNFLWRGQASDQSATSGGFDLYAENGLHVGVWTVNTSFAGSGYELDTTLGYAGQVGAVGYDLSVVQVQYPMYSGYDMKEFIVKGNYGVGSLEVAYMFDNDVEDETGSVYAALGLSFPLQEHVTLGLKLGQYNYSDKSFMDDYTHTSVELTKATEQMGNITLTFSQAGEEANGGNDDMRTVASWSLSF